MKRLTSASLAALLLLSACTGSFSLTKKIADFNRSFDSQWVEEAVFLGLLIVPVYEIALLGDALIFNSIEFWSGENPVGEEEQQLALGEEAAVKVLSDGRIELVVEGETWILERTDAGVVATDADGAVLYRAITDDEGVMSIYDADGNLVRRER